MKKFNIQEWTNDGMTFVTIDETAYVKVDDIQDKLDEIKKTLKETK